MRSGTVGERLVAENNVMVEQVLPAGMLRALSEADLAAYRAPFLRPEDRLPTLRWAREIPIAGQPADVRDLILRSRRALGLAASCRQNCPDLTIVNVGPGNHFLPEDRPHEIATALDHRLAE